MGVVSVIITEKNNLWNKFRSEFKGISKRRLRSRKLEEAELKNIHDFLQKRKIHMTVMELPKSYVGHLKNSKRNKKEVRERIIGATYFQLIKEVHKRSFACDMIVDADTWFNVDRAIEYAKRAAEADKYSVDISVSRTAHSKLLRLSDYVAYMPRKVSGQFLASSKYFKKIKAPIEERIIKKTMK